GRETGGSATPTPFLLRAVTAACPVRRRHVRRELGSGANVELAVDAREVRLHRLHAHEERRGDLFVRGAARREVGYLPFCGAQLSASRTLEARPLELESGAFGPES